MMTFPSTSKQWVVTHIPADFTLTCPEDFDEDRFLTEVLMAVNLADHNYQVAEMVETLAQSFIAYVSEADDPTGYETEYGWCLAEYAIEDAQKLFNDVKPALRYLENADGFGVDIRDAVLAGTSMMFVVEEI